MRTLTRGIVLITLLAGCGSISSTPAAVVPGQTGSRAFDDAAQAAATSNKIPFGKVRELQVQGFRSRPSLDGKYWVSDLRYRVSLQAGPDRSLFTKEESVWRTLYMASKLEKGGKGAPTYIALQTDRNLNLTVMSMGKLVPGVAPGLKSVEAEFQFMVSEIEKNRLDIKYCEANERADLLPFATQLRGLIARN